MDVEMTKQEQDLMVIDYMRKFQDLRKKESCLRARIREATEALLRAVNPDSNPADVPSNQNPYDDVRALESVRTELHECRKFLSEMGFGEFVKKS